MCYTSKSQLYRETRRGMGMFGCEEMKCFLKDTHEIYLAIQ